VAETTWLRQLLHELQTLPSRCTTTRKIELFIVQNNFRRLEETPMKIK
jgi:hypothetical protein